MTVSKLICNMSVGSFPNSALRCFMFVSYQIILKIVYLFCNLRHNFIAYKYEAFEHQFPKLSPDMLQTTPKEGYKNKEVKELERGL